MAEHNQTGTKGEKAAVDYLRQRGFAIEACNYRYKRAEIDIIARKENLLLFIEVKTRRTNQYGFPEEAVTQKKIDLFLMAADEYIHQHNWLHAIRFDIISLTGAQDPYQIHHIEDAFH